MPDKHGHAIDVTQHRHPCLRYSDDMRTALVLIPLATLSLLLAAVPAARAQDDRVRGARLADELCSGCHLVAEGGHGSANDGIPSFKTIASSDRSDAELRVWLTDPHPPMPRMPLSEREIAAVIAYIRSFAD